MRRRDALLAQKALYILPSLGAVSASGDLVYTIAVYGAPRKSALQSHLGDYVAINELADPPALYLLAHASDLEDATDRIAALKRDPGVADARMSLNREVFLNTAFVRRLVDARIERWQQARRKPTARAREPAR